MGCVLLSSLCSQVFVVSLLFTLKCLILNIYSLLCPSPSFSLYLSMSLSMSVSLSLSIFLKFSQVFLFHSSLNPFKAPPLSLSLSVSHSFPFISIHVFVFCSHSLSLLPCVSVVFLYIYISSIFPLEYWLRVCMFTSSCPSLFFKVFLCVSVECLVSSLPISFTISCFRDGKTGRERDRDRNMDR